uniref:Uncharacterized protein n=1 Tax=Heterorhabditis bacteriophora TaxID=37862 RepID=A0A1I7WN81_HETBA
MNMDIEMMADENDEQVSPIPRVIPPAPIRGDAETEDEEEERSFSSNNSPYVDDDGEQRDNNEATNEDEIKDEV